MMSTMSCNIVLILPSKALQSHMPPPAQNYETSERKRAEPRRDAPGGRGRLVWLLSFLRSLTHITHLFPSSTGSAFLSFGLNMT
ncbi:hypothetical protein F2P79_014604 [Pimephales promelas]|nr:hypothetical protein F2P79_014604 [Pimephales promelas]